MLWTDLEPVLKRFFSTLFFALPTSTLFLGACGPELEELSAQPLDRFPVGEVYWLPKAPEGASWEITENAGQNQLVSGEDGWTRFTPDAEGQYTFSLDGARGSRTLSAIDATELPFHNLNYLPSRSLATAGSTLLVTEGYTPRLARVNGENGQVIDEIPVGPWPVAVAVSPDESWALVAHAGNDTLGFVG